MYMYCFLNVMLEVDAVHPMNQNMHEHPYPQSWYFRDYDMLEPGLLSYELVPIRVRRLKLISLPSRSSFKTVVSLFRRCTQQQPPHIGDPD